MTLSDACDGEWIALAAPDATLALARRFLGDAEAERAFAALLAAVPWEQHRITIMGRSVDSPRRSCWIGDPGTDYTYSRTRFAPHPWPAALLPIREKLTAALAVPFNSVLANLYRDGADAMGWHADDERELGPEPVIASISLGATRRFAMKHRKTGTRLDIALEPGSLLVMSGTTQRHWVHALPRTKKPVGPRINLTFRVVGRYAGPRA